MIIKDKDKDMTEFIVSQEEVKIIDLATEVDGELLESDTETDGTMYTVGINEIIARNLTAIKVDNVMKQVTGNIAKRSVVREWLFRTAIIEIISTGLISYLTIKSLTFGVMLSTLLIVTLELIARSPQWLYECIKGYPVPPFLWMEGKEKPISILL